MNKYQYNNKEDERITEVSVEIVWLKEDLLPSNSAFRSKFPEFWDAIDEEVNLEKRGFLFELKDIKRCTATIDHLYIVKITTESVSKTDGFQKIGQKAFLSNKKSFIDITWLIGFTNLFGCKFQRLHSPLEDFVAEFIGDKYF